MKKTLLIAYSLFGCLSSIAQTQQYDFLSEKQNNEHRQLINSLLSYQTRVAEKTAQKPTGVKQRVIAQASIYVSYSDSATYKYSGMHGSYYDFNKLDMVYSKQFQNDDFVVSISYNSKTSNVLADSIIHFYSGHYDYLSVGQYRSDNQLDSFTRFSSTGSGSFKTVNSFNAMGLRNQSIMLSNYAAMPIYDSSSMIKYTYDANWLITDTIFSLDGSNDRIVRQYHYNNQNYLDSVLMLIYVAPYPVAKDLTTIQYNNSNQIQKVTSVQYGDTYVGRIIIDTFGYTGNSPFFTFYQYSWVDTGANLGDSSRIVKFVGSNNLPDSIQMMAADSGIWEPSYVYSYYYNSYNNPDSIIGKSYNFPLPSRHNFYYETYDDTPPTAIKNIEGPKDLSMYPNPFDQTIIIEWKRAHINQAKVSLVNILGQIVYSVNQPLATGNNTLNLPGLNKGNYIVLIQDGKGNSWKSQMIRN